MREAHFIDKNKAKWSEIEYNLKNKLNVHFLFGDDSSVDKFVTDLFLLPLRIIEHK